MSEHRQVRVWAGDWLERYVAARDGRDQVACGAVSHHKDSWFLDCEHTPTVWDYVESARAQCAESEPKGGRGNDSEVLEVISSVYFQAWCLHRRQGSDHVEQWPLALVVLAGLREAGYEVVKRVEKPCGASVEDKFSLAICVLSAHGRDVKHRASDGWEWD